MRKSHHPRGVSSVLSVDIIVDSQKGNLRDPKQQRRLIEAIRGGCVVAVYGGLAPCESWSVARYEALDGCNAPRPVRNASLPWGQLDLTVKEGDQVSAGNDLMGFAMHSMAEQAHGGGLSVLEHPDDPEEVGTRHTDTPSIWRTAIVQWLKDTGQFHKVRFLQGRMGAPSPKPTRLLVAGIGKTETSQLLKQFLSTTCATETSIGLHKGEWKTARLKEYPERMCDFLSSLLKAWLQDRSIGTNTPHSFEWLKALHVKDISSKALGQHYCPNI